MSFNLICHLLPLFPDKGHGNWMTCEVLPSDICDLLVAWRMEKEASKCLDVNEDALGLRIWGQTMLLCRQLVCRPSGGSTQQPVPQDMGTQPDVLLDPCGNGHAQPHSPQCSSLALRAQMLPQPMAASVQGMGVMQWCSGLQVLPSWGFLGSSGRRPQRKYWQGLALEKCLHASLFFPSFQFLAAWGPGTPWTTRWEATVQEVEN